MNMLSPFIFVRCYYAAACPEHGLVKQVWLRTVAAGIVEMPSGMLLCVKCGFAVEQVADYGGNPVMLNECQSCGCRFAADLDFCPQCSSTDYVKVGEDMPKNTVAGGPSNAQAGPGETGYMGQPDEPAGGPAGGAVTEQGGPDTATEPDGDAAAGGAGDGAGEMKAGDDPGAYSVRQVQAFIDACPDAAEVARVLAAESAGKNRKTIVGGE